jgi:hypothetical protein
MPEEESCMASKSLPSLLADALEALKPEYPRMPFDVQTIRQKMDLLRERGTLRRGEQPDTVLDDKTLGSRRRTRSDRQPTLEVWLWPPPSLTGNWWTTLGFSQNFLSQNFRIGLTPLARFRFYALLKTLKVVRRVSGDAADVDTVAAVRCFDIQ